MNLPRTKIPNRYYITRVISYNLIKLVRVLVSSQVLLQEDFNIDNSPLQVGLVVDKIHPHTLVVSVEHHVHLESAAVLLAVK